MGVVEHKQQCSAVVFAPLFVHSVLDKFFHDSAYGDDKNPALPLSPALNSMRVNNGTRANKIQTISEISFWKNTVLVLPSFTLLIKLNVLLHRPNSTPDERHRRCWV